MYDNNSKGISYTAGFFILIGFAFAALLAAALISIPIWTGMTGQSIGSMQKDMTNPVYSEAIKVIQVITAIIGFLLPAIFTALLLNRKPMKLLGFSGNIGGHHIGLTIAIVIFSLFVSGSLGYLNELIPVPESWRTYFDKLEKSYNAEVEAIISLKTLKDYIIAVLIMALLPAICEEALFRGGLQNFLSRSTRMPWFSIIVVSIIFSVAHFSYYGFLPRFFLGIMLGLLYEYSGRLWLSILAHFINNLFAVTAIYILTRQGKSIQDALAESEGSLWGLLALPVVIFLFIVFRNFSKKNKEEAIIPEVAPPQNNSGDIFHSSQNEDHGI